MYQQDPNWSYFHDRNPQKRSGKMTERPELSSEETEPMSLNEFRPGEELPAPAQRKKNKNRKKRFSDEQVRSLETIFESETKLEPRKKVQVAKELGLQPRQVAIWFQNKRARWKSKQIEKDFRILKAKFDHLKARFESTEEEKKSLLSQLQELNNVLQKTQDIGSSDFGAGSSSDNNQSRGDMVAAGLEAKPRAAGDQEVNPQGVVYLDDYGGRQIAYLEHEEPEQMNDNQSSSLLVPPVKWCSFDFFDHPSNSSYWWDSWT